ncbi:keratin-associated protein 5-9 [Periophthalmus magnuspinnatus]|uniref:keratin-associated protein 5-9 n=1 Tax=Periophthalmus magnuspinnatus TaxID=409849 RepID=UPI0024371573|nr:keratin-associated protein 5-9 [Periophthalmus magnuspinnatus]
MQVWQLALPLPAIFLITVGLYMLLLGTALWLRYCLKDHCSVSCPDCCSGVSLCENCFKMAEACDCRPPSVRSCFAYTCPSPSCSNLDCACTCQPPECDTCNCLCFEIRIK